jgi:hypothetical protein
MSLQVDLGSFDSRAAVYNFALKMTFRAVLLAFLFNLAFLPLGYALGLVPLSLADAVKLSVACSWLFGGAVSGALALITGHVIRDLSVSRAEFERLSRTDMLSGLLNRRAFNAALAETAPGASLAILDLDRFKAVNDGHGHCAGDEVIKAVASILREVFATGHFALGGYFLIVLSVVFIGMGSTILAVTLGPPSARADSAPYHDTVLSVGPPLILLLLVLVLGLYLPESIRSLVAEAAGIVEVPR